MIETTMNGKKYMASRVAATWRRALMKGKRCLYSSSPQSLIQDPPLEHLGLEGPPTRSEAQNTSID